MSEIAAAAGVSRATLHRRFCSREALIQAIAKTALAHMREVTDGISREGLTGRTALERILEQGANLGPQFGFLASESCVRDDRSLIEAIEQIFDIWAGWCEEGQRRGELRVDLPARWMVAAVDALVLAASEGVRSGVVAPRDALRLLRLTLFEGVVPSPPAPPLPGPAVVPDAAASPISPSGRNLP